MIAESVSNTYRERGWWRGIRLERHYERVVRAAPGALAVEDDRGRRLTRAGLWSAAADWARDLRAHGVGEHDVVLVVARNRVEWIVALLALLRVRAVPATAPATTDPATISYMLELIGARALVTASEEEGLLTAGAAPVPLLLFESVADRRWIASPDPGQTSGQAPPALDHVMFTSSTTGRPKAVMHSADTLAALNLGFTARFGLRASTPIFMPSPLGHSVGSIHGARLALYLGAPLVLQDRWDPERAIRLVAQRRCTFTAAATPFLKDLVDVAGEEKLASMRTFLCGGAPVPPVLIEQAHAQMPEMCTTVLWGMTEGGVTTGLRDTPRDLHASTAGVPLPGLELKTVDSDGAALPPESEGELAMRGPGVFIGYLGQDDLYRSLLTDDGFFRTGDLARIGEDGYLRITGRVKDLIIRGGVNISPVPIENLLATHPAVRRVAVIGAPDERLGERLCAVIEPRGEPPALDELIAWVSEQGLPRRMWPETLRIVSEMPTTAAGKIRKNRLREELVAAGEGR